MLAYMLLILGFVLVIKGAGFLVDGASSLARRLKVSDLVIGLTVVSFGTSLPELCINILASINGNSEIAIGNILGSNIANILLILGISSIIYPLAVTKGTVWKEIPFSLLAIVVLGILANDKVIEQDSLSALTRIDGLVLLSFFIIFLYYIYGIAKSIPGLLEHIPPNAVGLVKISALMVVGLFCLTLGSKWIIDGAVHMATSLGISESVIALTLVAVGTSLPELATSAVAAYRKNVDIAVGNVVGSNIFNIFLILGISPILHPLTFTAPSNVDIAVAVGATLLLFLWMFTGKKRILDRWEGVVFVILYAAYILSLFVRG